MYMNVMYRQNINRRLIHQGDRQAVRVPCATRLGN